MANLMPVGSDNEYGQNQQASGACSVTLQAVVGSESALSFLGMALLPFLIIYISTKQEKAQVVL